MILPQVAGTTCEELERGWLSSKLKYIKESEVFYRNPKLKKFLSFSNCSEICRDLETGPKCVLRPQKQDDKTHQFYKNKIF